MKSSNTRLKPSKATIKSDPISFIRDHDIRFFLFQPSCVFFLYWLPNQNSSLGPDFGGRYRVFPSDRTAFSIRSMAWREMFAANDRADTAYPDSSVATTMTGLDIKAAIHLATSTMAPRSRTEFIYRCYRINHGRAGIHYGVPSWGRHFICASSRVEQTPLITNGFLPVQSSIRFGTPLSSNVTEFFSVSE